MEQINLLPSAEEVKLNEGSEAGPIKGRKKRVAGGAAARVGETAFSSARVIPHGFLVILVLFAGVTLLLKDAKAEETPRHHALQEGETWSGPSPHQQERTGPQGGSVKMTITYRGSPTKQGGRGNSSKKAEVNMPREKVFDTGKVKINYLDYGNPSSEPLVMLHGGAWCWEEYLSLIPSLAQRWHPYALDFRGNGRSGWVPGQYRLEDFTEDTVAFVRQLKTPVVLVGHSMGGAVALMVAARYPEMVKALIIEDTPPSIGNYKRVVDTSREMYGTWLELKRSAQSEQELALALAERYQGYPGVTSQWMWFFARCLWLLDPTYFNQLQYDFDAFIKGYDEQMLARIKCPVLFMRGETELGAVMTDDEVSSLKTIFRNVSYAQIRGVGHLLHLQEAGQTPVLTEMLKFLERIPK